MATYGNYLTYPVCLIVDLSNFIVVRLTPQQRIIVIEASCQNRLSELCQRIMTLIDYNCNIAEVYFITTYYDTPS